MPSLFDLLDRFFPKLVDWEEEFESRKYRLGAKLALAELPALLASPDPPELVSEAIHKKKVGWLKKMLQRIQRGELTRHQAVVEMGFAAQVPSYYSNKAESQLLLENPNLLELKQAWFFIVEGVKCRFTIEWNESESFEQDLRTYVERRQPVDGRFPDLALEFARRRAAAGPDRFAAEISRLNQRGAGDELFAELKRKLPAVALTVGFENAPKVAKRPNRKTTRSPSIASPESMRHDLAWDIHKFIAKYKQQDHFKDLATQWIENQRETHESRTAWYDKRERHFGDTIPAKARLRDKRKGPPQKDWVWDCCHVFRGPNFEHIEGWTPAALLERNAPESLAYPLSCLALTPPSGAICKHTALAALHDSLFEGPDRIILRGESIEYEELVLRAGRLGTGEVAQLVNVLDTFRIEVKGAQSSTTTAPGAAKVASKAHDEVTHSPDFRSVKWAGENYSFTKLQAPMIKLLFEASEKGAPDVGSETLLEAVDAKSSRLVDIFRDNSAWGKLIVNGQTKGSKRLSIRPKT